MVEVEEVIGLFEILVMDFELVFEIGVCEVDLIIILEKIEVFEVMLLINLLLVDGNKMIVVNKEDKVMVKKLEELLFEL